MHRICRPTLPPPCCEGDCCARTKAASGVDGNFRPRIWPRIDPGECTDLPKPVSEELPRLCLSVDSCVRGGSMRCHHSFSLLCCDLRKHRRMSTISASSHSFRAASWVTMAPSSRTVRRVRARHTRWEAASLFQRTLPRQVTLLPTCCIRGFYKPENALFNRTSI